MKPPHVGAEDPKIFDILCLWGSIWDALRDLIPFVQFKNVKTPKVSVTFNKVAGFSLVPNRVTHSIFVFLEKILKIISRPFHLVFI